MCNKKEDCKCIAEILTVILVLQKNATCGESCLDSCDRGFLGCGTTSAGCNTRPVMLYNCGCDAKAFAMPISKDPNECVTSNVFRVEKVDGNCATFRVLVPNHESKEHCESFAATNSFFTMDLNCCCAIRCLNDTFVECL